MNLIINLARARGLAAMVLYFILFNSALALETRSICGQTVTSNSYTGVIPSWLDGNAYIFNYNRTVSLGAVSSNAYNTDSILNQNGIYGSSYSSSSIFNDYGTYGSSYSSNSACNTYAPSGSVPQIWRNGSFIGYLTKNQFTSGAIDPATLVGALLKQGFGSSVAADLSAPTVPTGFAGVAVSPTQINFTWNASLDNVGVTAYLLYSGNVLSNVLAASPTGLALSSLTPATTYTFKLAACDLAANCSSLGNAIVVTTPAIPTTITTAPTTTTTQATTTTTTAAPTTITAPTTTTTTLPIQSTFVVSALAGAGVQGSNDAAGNLASFHYPTGTAVNAEGTLYVADSGNHKIRKISTTGVVSTLAGTGVQGSTDGNISSATFYNPEGVAIDTNGNLFVADTRNNKIRKISQSGIVSTFAGTGLAGSADGDAKIASFNRPYALAFDLVGNLYVADTSNNKIRKITASGLVTTLAGTGAAGAVDGNANSASFNDPRGIAVDKNGNIFIVDTNNHKIRKINSSGQVSTLAGTGVLGGNDGAGNLATFASPYHGALDSNGNLYVADSGNNKIRKISSSGMVSTFAGNGAIGSSDGLTNVSSFYYPLGVAVDVHNDIFVADSYNHKIRKVTTNTNSTSSTTTTSTTAITTTTNAASTTTTTVISSVVSITKGWNLIGAGGHQPFKVSSIFSDTNTFVTVWKWIADRGQWAFYAPSMSANALSDYALAKGYQVLDTIQGSDGFWVNASSDKNVTLPFGAAYTAVDHRTSLITGWNLISSGDNLPPVRFNNYLTIYSGAMPPSIGSETTTTVYQDNLTSLWAWDAVNSAWFFYAPSLDRSQVLADYVTSKGYQDFTKQSKKLGSGTGFWVNMPSK